MLSAYINLLFCSYLTERQQTVSISGYSLNPPYPHPSPVSVYPKAPLSVLCCFFCTHNHSHKSLVDTLLPTPNLPMIASCISQWHGHNIFAPWLVTYSQSYIADVNLWVTQNKLQLYGGKKTKQLLIDPHNLPNLPLSVVTYKANFIKHTVCYSTPSEFTIFLFSP